MMKKIIIALFMLITGFAFSVSLNNGNITIEVDDEQIDVKCAETQDHKGLLEIHLPKSLLEQLRTSFGVELFVTFARPEKDWIVKKDITQLKLIWA